MSDPGVRNMGLGFLWFAGGGLVTLVTYSAASGGGVYVVAYGAIAVGALQFLVGLGQFLFHRVRGPEGRAVQQAKVSVTALVQSMVAMSVADGKLDEQEIAVISQIYEQLTGAALESELIRETADEMRKHDFSISDALVQVQGQIDRSTKQLIVKAAYFVMAADSEVDEEEKKLLSEIAGSLRISDAEFGEILSEVTTPAMAPASSPT
ncbi:MAG: TerB family tellurite resistance protein [Kiloniellales bacterium]